MLQHSHFIKYSDNVISQDKIKFRKAILSEQKLLTDLAVASKASWGYDKEFIHLAMPDLIVREDSISNDRVTVLEYDSKLIGFYELDDEEEPEMTALFVDQNFIGKGFGKLLWQEAIKEAKNKGWKSFKIVADPFAAERFYLPQGCLQIGDVASIVDDVRRIPLLKYVLK